MKVIPLLFNKSHAAITSSLYFDYEDATPNGALIQRQFILTLGFGSTQAAVYLDAWFLDLGSVISRKPSSKKRHDALITEPGCYNSGRSAMFVARGEVQRNPGIEIQEYF